MEDVSDMAKHLWYARVAHLFDHSCRPDIGSVAPGDVIYLRYGTEGLLVLNSVRAAVELLDQRSAIYSSRPPAIMAHEFATAGLSVSMTPAGTRFRKHRKAFQSAFGSAKLSSFHGPIAKEAVVLAHDLLQAPDSFEAHYKRSVWTCVKAVAHRH